MYRLLKGGKKSLINYERIVKLENVGFQWVSDSQLIPNKTWNERLSEMLDFKQRWGNYYVPQKYAKDSNPDNWASHPRQKYRLLKCGKKSLINNERIVQLENVGFKWESSSATQQKICDKNPTCIQEFKQKGGHTEVTKDYPQRSYLRYFVD